MSQASGSQSGLLPPPAGHPRETGVLPSSTSTCEGAWVGVERGLAKAASFSRGKSDLGLTRWPLSPGNLSAGMTGVLLGQYRLR